VTFEALSLRELDACALASRALERANLPADRLSVVGTPRAQGDATLIVRALANLLENARNHGGGVEALEVQAEAGQVRFAVRDRGPGFADGDEVRAFDPFFHRPRSDGGDSGSLGLGLALVQRIARAHGGDAFARNRAEGGAEVGFTVKAAA
jgi:signal transduction histidine kinase